MDDIDLELIELDEQEHRRLRALQRMTKLELIRKLDEQTDKLGEQSHLIGCLLADLDEIAKFLEARGGDSWCLHIARDVRKARFVDSYWHRDDDNGR